MAVELGTVTLEHLTEVEVVDRSRLARHEVPGLEGDLIQQLGRSSAELILIGSVYGDDAASQLAELRAACRSSDPLDLLAHAAGDGYVAKVVVAQVEVAERVGRLDCFDYRITLVEHVEPPAVPAFDPLAEVDTGLATEAASYLDDVQDAVGLVSELASLTQIAGFADPTTKAPQMLDDFRGAGGGDTAPTSALRDLL
jgi:prophage DNA circulation protein